MTNNLSGQMTEDTLKLPEDDVLATESLSWLMGRINYERVANIPYHERQLKLDRMRQLLTRLGNPDAGMKIVHVAGTKGKGSTCAMIAAVLRSAGYRTGVFSSPHLERIEERFAVDGARCPTADFCSLIGQMRPVVEEMDSEAVAQDDPQGGPTFFEITTALSLKYFADCQVDFAVLEVGLGGRLDSTNVCLPMVSVITSISFDHTKQLGSTLAEIAWEKAGIIKPGVPVISGVTEQEPQKVIAARARELGCRLIQLGRDFELAQRIRSAVDSSEGRNALPRLKSSMDIKLRTGEPAGLQDLTPAVLGRHQAQNAAVAIATLWELKSQGLSVSEEAVREGLSLVRVPARVEYFAGPPATIVDSAHNVASAGALVESLEDFFPDSHRTLVCSISRDKDVQGIVHRIAPHFQSFVLTEYQENPRAVPAAELAQLFQAEVVRSGKHREAVVEVPLPIDAWQHALEHSRENDLIVISGSFFIAAELLGAVQSHSNQPSPNN